MLCHTGEQSKSLLTAGRLAASRSFKPCQMSSHPASARRRPAALHKQQTQLCRASAATEKLDAKPLQPNDFMQVSGVH